MKLTDVLVPIYRGYFNIQKIFYKKVEFIMFSSPFIEDTSILKGGNNYDKPKPVLVPIYRGYFNIGDVEKKPLCYDVGSRPHL